MTHTSPAAQLRAAAEKIRKLATEATSGPWRASDTHLGALGGHTATVLSGEGNDTDLRAWLPSMTHDSWDEARNVWADSAYIAAMHPGVGLAIADWLETTADYVDSSVSHPTHVVRAYAVARRLLGEGVQR